MPDEVEKSFVKSFIGFLKKQIENQSLSSDGLESIEVAVQCLEAAFEVNNDDETAATASSSAGPAAAAVDLFDVYQSMYAEKNPESKEVGEQIKNEGNRLMKESKYYEALLQYNRAITFDPKNPVFYCNRAAAYIRLGDHDKAIADCKLALVYNPDYAKAYGRMGIAYSNLSKFDEARSAYLKAILLEPDNQDYRNNLRVAEERIAQQPAVATDAGGLPQGLPNLLSNPNASSFIRDMMQDPMITTALQSLASNPGGLFDMSRQIVNQLSQQNPEFLTNIRDQLSSAGVQQPATAPGPDGSGYDINQAQTQMLFQDALNAFQNNIVNNSTGTNATGNNSTGDGSGAGGDNKHPPPPSS